jgi:hypothetical protein
MFIKLSAELVEVGRQETAVRLRNYDRLQLPTDCSSGKYSREQRQFIGVLGEVAFRVACDDPPRKAWSKSGLDGGSDYTMDDGRTVQIMTACGNVCRFCYFPEFKPLKADIIVQGRFIAKPVGVVFMGAISLEHFNAIAKFRPIGNKEYMSVYVHQMMSLEDPDDPI